jgi:nucleoside-diphosphate-sugar epimerase
MKVLFVGGTGVISSACSDLAIKRGIDLYLFNRGQTSRPIPEGAHVIHGDYRDRQAVEKALAGYEFDAVVDWIAFTPSHVEMDIDLYQGRVGQYVFISSASAYQKPPARLPITESTPLRNPFWEYSQNKIACEDRLVRTYREDGFPITIVRPSHTYDQTKIPIRGRYAAIDRMRRGKRVFVHGDGTSLWVLTHHEDFARGFVGLLGNPQAIGEAFHITSDEALTWDQIHHILARAAGTTARIVHAPSELIAAYDPELGAGLLGDKTHSVIFDNTKIKRVVPDFVASIPFARAAEEIIAWYDADPARQIIDEEFNRLTDRIIEAMESARPDGS